MRSVTKAVRPLLVIAFFASLLILSDSPMWAEVNEKLSSGTEDQIGEVQLISEVAAPINIDVEPAPAYAPPALIDLASENSSAIVTDRLAANEVTHYVIRGIPGQQMRVVLDAVPPLASFALHGVDDRQVYHSLLADSDAVTDGMWSSQEWSGILPNDQEYLLSVAGKNEDVDFMISVEMLESDDFFQSIPTEVLIPEGKQAGMVSGHIDATTQHRYSVQVDAGDSINVALKSDDASVTFGIHGLSDGRSYKWLYDSAQAWSLVSPKSQEYILLVATDEESADYSLVITLP